MNELERLRDEALEAMKAQGGSAPPGRQDRFWWEWNGTRAAAFQEALEARY